MDTDNELLQLECLLLRNRVRRLEKFIERHDFARRGLLQKAGDGTKPIQHLRAENERKQDLDVSHTII